MALSRDIFSCFLDRVAGLFSGRWSSAFPYCYQDMVLSAHRFLLWGHVGIGARINKLVLGAGLGKAGGKASFFFPFNPFRSSPLALLSKLLYLSYLPETLCAPLDEDEIRCFGQRVLSGSKATLILMGIEGRCAELCIQSHGTAEEERILNLGPVDPPDLVLDRIAAK
ncbi:hypothetical protein Tco_1491528 [Tanacetum coccineum]